jgi:hypothetical protein
VIRIFSSQHVGQETWSSQCAINRALWRGFLHNGIASVASQLRTDRTHHFEAARNKLEHFGNVFAQVLQRTAAIRTTTVLRRKRFGFPWQFGW